MQLSRVDRNRMRVAGIVTALIIPVALMAGGRSADSTATTVVDTTTTTLDVGLSTDADQDAPANLGGPVSNKPNGQGQIAYPADNDGKLLRGTASFKQFPIGDGQACTSNTIPLGAVVTVRNLNNGRKVTCTNINSVYVPPGFDIVLNLKVFTDIAELVDAPLPVELTW